MLRKATTDPHLSALVSVLDAQRLMLSSALSLAQVPPARDLAFVDLCQGLGAVRAAACD